mmetsp:Transcript_10548/g.30031  ORF Transcript_10548/g.30031 Transcript_10548/m.30031 type:complete len:437 (+) Transcript_10548:286-1596(+)|eukprot:CAMPEP_0117682948 /NCGR_PEP_ID=MMETSP0804-20121206/20035_1 /TAXON_ID=1074897 /ORGANISM="Tetraselmis astigmatica, Strain CCMP880" /LENGTH=436 /DNA_ID=CAMNT_0005493301 /DNA_START=260 /DNA_END=1570 /DNA_ORIENTATION=+
MWGDSAKKKNDYGSSVKNAMVGVFFATVKPFKIAGKIMGDLINQNKVALIGLGVVTAYNIFRTRYQTSLVSKIEAARDAYLAKRRINQARRRLASPLLRAALDVEHHIKQLLEYGEGNFYMVNFKEKPEMALMTTIYEISKFIHYRWLLHDQTKYDLVAHMDGWQFVVGRVLEELEYAMESKSIRVTEYAQKWVWMGNGSVSPVDSYFCESDKQIRASLSLYRRQQYPLRFLPSERAAIAELMVRHHNLNDKGESDPPPECLRFVDFVRMMKAALKAVVGERDHQWVPYMVPIWKDLIRYVSLQIHQQDGESLPRMQELELIQFRVRLRAVQWAIRDLIEVLAVPPDAWLYREYHAVHGNSARSAGRRLVNTRGLHVGPGLQHFLSHAGNDTAEEWRRYISLRLRVRLLWEIVRGHTWLGNVEHYVHSTQQLVPME